MSWTAPRNWTTGEIVTAAELNTNIRDNLNALATGLARVALLPAAPATTTGMGGLGSSAVITTVACNRVRFSFTFDTGNTNCQYGIRYGTGTAPTNGAAATGTIYWPLRTMNNYKSACLVGIITVTVGVATWFDFELNDGSGSVSITSLGITLEEV